MQHMTNRWAAVYAVMPDGAYHTHTYWIEVTAHQSPKTYQPTLLSCW